MPNEAKTAILGMVLSVLRVMPCLHLALRSPYEFYVWGYLWGYMRSCLLIYMIKIIGLISKFDRDPGTIN